MNEWKGDKPVTKSLNVCMIIFEGVANILVISAIWRLASLVGQIRMSQYSVPVVEMKVELRGFF